MKHILRYGIAQDHRYFEDFASTYDLVAINGNMLAHSQASIATFISQRLVNKPFFVDPLTHAFQHGANVLVSKKTSETRSSLQKLIRAYGEPLREDGSACLPTDFAGATLSGFCERVLTFQRETVRKESAEVHKYLAAVGADSTLMPEITIAPYFYMDDLSYEAWLPVNLRAIEICTAISDTWAQVVLSKEILLNDTALETIVKAYCGSSAKGFLLWIDSFVETRASTAELQAYASLIQRLRRTGQVYALYGGYFSMLLHAFIGLEGVGHGLEYGEDRAVVPVGGGIPVSKYYFPALHNRIKWSEAYNILIHAGILTSENPKGDVRRFHNEVCDCVICVSAINGNMQNFSVFGESKPSTFMRAGRLVTVNFPLPETKDKCVRHYLWKKAQEIRTVQHESPAILLGKLKAASEYAPYRRVLGLAGTSYLARWHSVLSGLK